MPFLVHGVCRERPDSGAHAPAFRAVAEGPLVGLVSETDDPEALPTRANLLHHTEVLEHAAAHGTVIPMRFGVVVPDVDALVEELLVPERDELLAMLERLDGHVELRLRGTYDEPLVIRAVLDDDPRSARLKGRRSTDARLELGERVVAGIERRRERDQETIAETLRPHASGISATAVTQPLDAVDLSFLVAADDRDAFEAAVDALGERLAPLVQLELVGPIPPFSFTDRSAGPWG